MAFSDALYLAFPFKQINWTPDVLSGVGIFTSIFWPNSDGLKFDFNTTCVRLTHRQTVRWMVIRKRLTLTSILVRPTSRTNGITRNGNDISLVVRYRINSNSPSGGMKLIECSVSNLLSFTHWWNWQSSMTTTGFPDRDVSASVFPEIPPRPLASITILSLMPNLHSGIPWVCFKYLYSRKDMLREVSLLPVLRIDRLKQMREETNNFQNQ